MLLKKINNLINSNDYEIIFVNDKFNELNLNGKNVKVIGLVDKTSELNDKNYFDRLYYPLEFRDINKIINNIYQYGEVK